MTPVLPVALDAQPTTTVVVSGVRPPKLHYLDCRSCQHRTGRTCDSTTRCERGELFTPLQPLQLWKQP